MRTIPAGRFKAECLKLLDEVAETGEPILATKRGKPVAQLRPAEEPPSLKGSVIYLVSDEELIAPIDEIWNAEISFSTPTCGCGGRRRTRSCPPAHVAEIDAAPRIGCTISCYELARAAARRRIRLDRDLGTWINQALAGERVDALELTGRIATEAGKLDDTFPGDPVDRIIYATTRERRARLVTRDRALRRVDPVLTVW